MKNYMKEFFKHAGREDGHNLHLREGDYVVCDKCGYRMFHRLRGNKKVELHSPDVTSDLTSPHQQLQ